MKFVRVRIAGVSRLPDPAGWLSGNYEVRWCVEEPFFEGNILARTPDEVWPAICEAVRKWWAGRAPPDPMMELVGHDMGIDAEGSSVEAGCI